MYNTKDLEPFFEKVIEEATEAAQQVFNKYRDEAIQRIKNQMGKNHKLLNCMGVVQVTGTKNDDETSNGNFCRLLQQIEYDETINAGFNLPSEITK